MGVAYRNENHRANSIRRRERLAVAGGRADWVFSRPLLATPPVVKRLPAVEVRQPATRPVRHVRRSFGEGLGERNPTYRAPVALSDMQWWADEARREEDAEYDRMAAIAAAEARFDGWF